VFINYAFEVHLFICGNEHAWLAHWYARAYFDVLCRVLLGHNAEISVTCQLGSKFEVK